MLTVTIEVPPGQHDAQTFPLKLRITNPAGPQTTILNPEMGVPSLPLKRVFSKEAYQTSLLISFGYLSISVTDETGKELPQQSLQTWSTPILRPPIELLPGASFEIVIPIGNFYQLEADKTYSVTIEYGDKNLRVSAHALVTVL